MSYMYTLSHTFRFDVHSPTGTQRLQDTMEKLGQAYMAAVPFEQRHGTNISLHRPDDMVLCLQYTPESGQKVWHLPPQAGGRAQVLNDDGHVVVRGTAYGIVMIGGVAYTIVDRDESDWVPHRLVVPSRLVEPEGT
jgi:hypothetical protein